jgi:hypothetical protein
VIKHQETGAGAIGQLIERRHQRHADGRQEG